MLDLSNTELGATVGAAALVPVPVAAIAAVGLTPVLAGRRAAR